MRGRRAAAGDHARTAPTSPLLVAVDIDGTLVQTASAPASDRVAFALAAVRAAGHHIVLATGRTPEATVPALAALGWQGGLAVCSNGGVTVRFGRDGTRRHTTVSVSSFEPTAVLLRLMAEPAWSRVAVELSDGSGLRASASFGALPPSTTAVAGLRGAATGRAVRVLVRTPLARVAELLQVADELGLRGVLDESASDTVMELLPRGVSKASALEALRSDLGVATARTVAVGNHLNDVEMLGWAAHGVAMGGSPPELTHVADAVAGPVEHDGLADVLEALLVSDRL